MAGPGLVAGEVAVDALPYFDQGYEAPGVREAVRVASRERREAGWGPLRLSEELSESLSAFLSGRGAGGGGDAALQTHQELSELPGYAGLQHFRGERDPGFAWDRAPIEAGAPFL